MGSCDTYLKPLSNCMEIQHDVTIRVCLLYSLDECNWDSQNYQCIEPTITAEDCSSAKNNV